MLLGLFWWYSTFLFKSWSLDLYLAVSDGRKNRNESKVHKLLYVSFYCLAWSSISKKGDILSDLLCYNHACFYRRIFIHAQIYIYIPRTQMTHILKALTHKMEGQPPEKKEVRWVPYVYTYHIWFYSMTTLPTLPFQTNKPNNPCIVYLPTFTIKKSTIHVGKYTIQGSYGKTLPSLLGLQEIREKYERALAAAPELMPWAQGLIGAKVLAIGWGFRGQWFFQRKKMGGEIPECVLIDS